jgi:hypothetical protein
VDSHIAKEDSPWAQPTSRVRAKPGFSLILSQMNRLSVREIPELTFIVWPSDDRVDWVRYISSLTGFNIVYDASAASGLRFSGTENNVSSGD